jgi:peptidoglycan biosynthesis protein MviN/MurJ (putative lipid II flippase)
MFRRLGSGMLILILSRAIGVARDLVITLAFGLTLTTDRFYQAIFPMTCVIAIMSGPFTTAFAARLAAQQIQMRRAHLKQIGSRIGWVAGISCGLSGLFALVLWCSPFATYQALAVPIALLSPAIAAAIVVGYVAAVAISAGRVAAAAIGNLTANAAFLLLAGSAWLVVSDPQDWLLPLCYGLAMVFALWPTWAIYTALRRNLPARSDGTPEKIPIPGFVRSFSFASAESCVFFATQLVVLVIASSQGDGVASASALSQRICFSVIGLFVLPFASLVMLRIIGDIPVARSVFMQNLGLLVLVLLAMGGVVLQVILPIVQRFIAPDFGALLGSFLPPFAFWVLPLGANAFLCRVMFGLGLDRPYTVITIFGYLVANVARVIAASFGGLGTAILAGAAVEAGLSLVLVLITLRRLPKKNRPK